MQKREMAFRPSADRRCGLIVEDEFISQEILRFLLPDSYDPVPAETGTENPEERVV